MKHAKSKFNTWDNQVAFKIGEFAKAHRVWFIVLSPFIMLVDIMLIPVRWIDDLKYRRNK